MTFISPEKELIRARIEDVPAKIVSRIGLENISGKRVLDVGCGEMMMDFALLDRGAKHVTGVDVIPASYFRLVDVPPKIRDAGFKVRPDALLHLAYHEYNGTKLPFPDKSFDTIISWGVFEHVAQVPELLREMRRVLTDDGAVLISVFPWWHCAHGSHLSDYIPEPYFHLHRPDAWVRARLDEYVAKNPDSKALMDHMWREYQSLNRMSVDDFSTHCMDERFSIVRCEHESYASDLSVVPPFRAPVSRLMTSGSTIVMRKNNGMTPRMIATINHKMWRNHVRSHGLVPEGARLA